MSKQDIWQWLGPLAERWKGEANLREQSIVLTWRTVGLSSLAQAMYVDRGVLHLGVASHVVAAELNLLKRKVVARVKEAVPGAGITDLRFHIRAQAEQPGQIAVPAPTAAARRRARAELSPKLPTSLRAGLSEILAWAQARDQAILEAGGWVCPRCELVLVRHTRSCPCCQIEAPMTRG